MSTDQSTKVTVTPKMVAAGSAALQASGVVVDAHLVELLFRTMVDRQPRRKLVTSAMVSSALRTLHESGYLWCEAMVGESFAKELLENALGARRG